MVSQFIAQAVEPNGIIFWIDKLARTSLSTILIFALVLTGIRLVLLPTIKNTPAHKRTGLFSFARVVNETSDALIYASVVVFMLVRPFGIQTFHIPTGSMLQTLHERDFIIANKLVYRYTDPKVGDIVVFRPPDVAFGEKEQKTDYIKRLVGAPGDIVEMKDMVLYRNGEKIDEPYLFYSDGPTIPFRPLSKDRWIELIPGEPDFKLIEVDGQVIPLLYKGNTTRVRYPVRPDFTRPQDDGNLALSDMQPVEWIGLPAAKIPDGFYLFMGDHRNGSSDGRIWGLAPRDNIIGRSEVIMMPLGRIGKTR